MTTVVDGPGPAPSLVGVADRMAAIGAEVAGPEADEVDRLGRFPVETIDALRAEGLLSALVPTARGGAGASLEELGRGLTGLGRNCASSAMVVAMHHIQVALLVRHGRNGVLRSFLERVVEEQLLLASATTEVGTGGNLGRSICAVEREGGRFRLEKQAPVISYGRYADAVLATARRSSTSPESDQVLVLCTRPGLELEQVGEWNALGFRGTCSPGFRLRGEGDEACVLDDPYAEISARTMLPVSHVVWSALWLGIATDAVDRARTYVQKEARKNPGTLPVATRRLADTVALHQQFADLVHGAARRFDLHADDPDTLDSPGFSIAMNSLKVSASTLVVDIVRECMVVCGLSSYLLDTPTSLGRHLRDAMGASLMVNNDRIMGNNAQKLLILRGE